MIGNVAHDHLRELQKAKQLQIFDFDDKFDRPALT